MHEGKAVSGAGGGEGRPAVVPLAPGEVLHGTGELLGVPWLEAEGGNASGGGSPLGGGEEAELVEELGAADVKEGEDFWVDVGGDEGVADLGGDDEAVLLDAGDAGGFFNGGWGEGVVAGEEGDEGGVLVPEAEAVAEDVEDGLRGEGGLQGRRRAEGLVELLVGEWRWWE